jgi:hypothetical protein
VNERNTFTTCLAIVRVQDIEGEREGERVRREGERERGGDYILYICRIHT